MSIEKGEVGLELVELELAAAMAVEEDQEEVNNVTEKISKIKVTNGKVKATEISGDDTKSFLLKEPNANKCDDNEVNDLVEVLEVTNTLQTISISEHGPIDLTVNKSGKRPGGKVSKKVSFAEGCDKIPTAELTKRGGENTKNRNKEELESQGAYAILSDNESSSSCDESSDDDSTGTDSESSDEYETKCEISDPEDHDSNNFPDDGTEFPEKENRDTNKDGKGSGDKKNEIFV